jgi:hypothetical protein
MGYPRAIQIYQAIANTTHIRFHSSIISAIPSWYWDIQQQYTQTINNTLHRFTSTPAYHILSQNVMPTLNMDNTIAGSIIPRRKLNICLKGRMYLLKTIAHVKQELLTLPEHMNAASVFNGARVARS